MSRRQEQFNSKQDIARQLEPFKISSRKEDDLVVAKDETQTDQNYMDFDIDDIDWSDFDSDGGDNGAQAKAK